MSEFTRSLNKQKLDIHTNFLDAKGYSTLIDRANEARKLHDFYDERSKIWIECKTDFSKDYYHRMLVEYKANVPLEWVQDLPFRIEVDFGRLISRIMYYPTSMDGIAIDRANLETPHVFSYLFAHTEQHYLTDLHQLQEQIRAARYPLIIVGNDWENWRSICSVVPIADCNFL